MTSSLRFPKGICYFGIDDEAFDILIIVFNLQNVFGFQFVNNLF